MALSAKEKRALVGASHRLKPAVVLDADGVSASAAEHVRNCFADREMIKVRIHADSGAACDAAAVELAEQVPCEIIKRIGRVVLLYRTPTEPERTGGEPGGENDYEDA